jgi:SAM-dependent MidA family methyltransferase
VRGVLLAHEVLDALAVERIVWDGALWRQQLVVLHEETGAELSLRLEPGEPLEPERAEALQALALLPPSPQRPPGWCTELHPGLQPWLAQAAAALAAGPLLVIDYALEAWRYYAPQRSAGTVMAYRRQAASADPLQDPGEADLTAHLCIESLERAALASGWQPLGGCRQGEALLALGLAQRLHGLQSDPGGLAALLPRRESLLRLVDPHALGDFRWLAFGRGGPLAPPRFLQDPGCPNS